MRHLMLRFWSNEQGQDLTEYGLLLAFVVIASAGIFLVNGSSLVGIWGAANSIIKSGAVTAQAGS